MTLSFALSWCTVQSGCVCFSLLCMYSHMSWLIALCLNPVNLCTTMWHLVWWCWLSSCLGEQPSLWELDTQEQLSDRKKQTRQTYGRTDFWFLDIMLKDWWDTNALLVGVSSYGFRIMGVASDNFDTTVFLIVKCLFILVYPWWNKQQEIFHLHHHYILRQFNTHIP